MISRRKFFGGIAATAAVGSGLTVLAANANAGQGAKGSGTKADGLTLTIANNTGKYDNAQVWVYIVGNKDGKQVRATAEGTTEPVAIGDNGGDGFTDYAIPLSGSGDTKLTLPKMSGRIYFALGDKLKFKAVEDGAGGAALAYPAGWVESDPNYDILHDCAEFTYNDDGMFCNTTMVDMFSVPLNIHLVGAKDQKAGETVEGARDKVFEELKGIEAFAPLVLGNGLRVVAPGHGMGSGLFPEDYFAPAIDEVWSQYESKDLKVTTNAGEFTGRVSGGKFTFSGPKEVSFDKPTTKDVLFCDGALAAPNDGTTGPVAAILGAGFNRSTLLSGEPQPGTEPDSFYQEEITNHYAKAMHAVSKDGKAYGFAFDDVAGFASYIEDGAPSAMTITLEAF